MRKILACAFFGAALFITPASHAAVPEGEALSPALVKNAAAWVASAMHIKVPFLPLATASGAQLKNSLGLEGALRARSMAAYIPGRIIVNNTTWDAESVTMQSYLVHEMVHHAQLFAGHKYACNGAKEREAYTLQNRWLQEHGAEPLYDSAFIDNVSRCKR